jgi:hypothetical protein
VSGRTTIWNANKINKKKESNNRPENSKNNKIFTSELHEMKGKKKIRWISQYLSACSEQ